MKKLLFIALFLSLGFSAFALTFDAGGGTINAYSSLRLFWQYQNIDIDRADSNARDYNRNSIPIGAQSNSRLGFTFAKDNYGAQVEFGLNLVEEHVGSANSSLRLAHFNYGFDGIGKLTVGLQPSLTGTDTYFSQKLNPAITGGDDGASGIGGVSTERHAAITFALKDNLASIQLTPTAKYTTAITAAGSAYSQTYDNNTNANELRQLIPMISLGFDGSKALQVPVKVGLTYALFSGIGDDNSTPTDPKNDETYNINAFIATVVTNPQFGPFGITVGGFYSMNGNVFGEIRGWNGGRGQNTAVGAITTFSRKKAGEIYDIIAFGVAAEGRYKINDAVTAALGGGYQQFSFDKAQAAWEDASNFGIYANTTIKLGKVFSIIPEVDYLQLESVSTGHNKKADKLNEIIVGAQLKLDI
jgi:hypothetical protein